MSDLNWYVVKAISGQEKKVKTYLENEIGRENLTEVIPQILIPSEKVYEMRNGKKRIREKNFILQVSFYFLFLSRNRLNYIPIQI